MKNSWELIGWNYFGEESGGSLNISLSATQIQTVFNALGIIINNDGTDKSTISSYTDKKLKLIFDRQQLESEVFDGILSKINKEDFK